MIVSSRLLVPHKIDAKCGDRFLQARYQNRGKPAFRSLRDEALTKFGEFIGAGREFSFCDSPYTCAKQASERSDGPYRCPSAHGLAARLDLRSAAVNEQFDTRDETGVIRREKRRHLVKFAGNYRLN